MVKHFLPRRTRRRAATHGTITRRGWSGRHTRLSCNTVKRTFPHIFRLRDNSHCVTTTSRKWPARSEPNHLMLIAAASPIIDNANKKRAYQPQEPFNIPTLPKALEKRKLTWGYLR